MVLLYEYETEMEEQYEKTAGSDELACHYGSMIQYLEKQG